MMTKEQRYKLSNELIEWIFKVSLHWAKRILSLRGESSFDFQD